MVDDEQAMGGTRRDRRRIVRQDADAYEGGRSRRTTPPLLDPRDLTTEGRGAYFARSDFAVQSARPGRADRETPD